ncbi:putative uncharacterized protein MGC39545 [Gorilla gorilla gorilla]|uniref:putative uncharacterized protein MGC39545 n=1 Tax=Gorilla gorilla gorilla TaxID=9595 RepID=UPI00300A8273
MMHLGAAVQMLSPCFAELTRVERSDFPLLLRRTHPVCMFVHILTEKVFRCIWISNPFAVLLVPLPLLPLLHSPPSQIPLLPPVRDRQKGRRAGCDTPSTPSNTAPRAPEPGAHPTAARPATAQPPRSLLPPVCSKTIALPASAAAASGSDTAGMRGLGKAPHSGEGHERGRGNSKMKACNNYQYGYLAGPDTSFWIKCRRWLLADAGRHTQRPFWTFRVSHSPLLEAEAGRPSDVSQLQLGSDLKPKMRRPAGELFSPKDAGWEPDPAEKSE